MQRGRKWRNWKKNRYLINYPGKKGKPSQIHDSNIVSSTFAGALRENAEGLIPGIFVLIWPFSSLFLLSFCTWSFCSFFTIEKSFSVGVLNLFFFSLQFHGLFGPGFSSNYSLTDVAGLDPFVLRVNTLL